VPIAIITNGVRYLFFTDLEEKQHPQRAALLSVQHLRLHDQRRGGARVLRTRTLRSATIRERVEEIIYANKINAYIGDVLRSPSESFTRFVLSELNLFSGGKKLTPKLVEKFIPTIRRAIQTTLLDMATRSIRSRGMSLRRCRRRR
jgi:hypothetical protein